ncbi:hypothetical protein OQ968_20540 [Mycobacterium sp. 663a-19]|nr:hypothetical protein [Mycobacterium sp. 663a-19]
MLPSDQFLVLEFAGDPHGSVQVDRRHTQIRCARFENRRSRLPLRTLPDGVVEGLLERHVAGAHQPPDDDERSKVTVIRMVYMLSIEPWWRQAPE